MHSPVKPSTLCFYSSHISSRREGRRKCSVGLRTPLKGFYSCHHIVSTIFIFAIFMSNHEIWPKSGGVPPNYEILKARTKGCVPDNVGIDPLPLGSNMYTSVGIPWGSLILSPAHLEHVRFPLHPLFHMLLFFLGLHPMQLNPNSYLLISGFLAVGLKWGMSLSFKDFIYLYDLACVRGKVTTSFLRPGLVKMYLLVSPFPPSTGKTNLS